MSKAVGNYIIRFSNMNSLFFHSDKNNLEKDHIRSREELGHYMLNTIDTLLWRIYTYPSCYKKAENRYQKDYIMNISPF